MAVMILAVILDKTTSSCRPAEIGSRFPLVSVSIGIQAEHQHTHRVVQTTPIKVEVAVAVPSTATTTKTLSTVAKLDSFETPPPLHYSPITSDPGRSSTGDNTPVGTPTSFAFGPPYRRGEKQKDLYFSWHRSPSDPATGQTSLFLESALFESDFEDPSFPLFAPPSPSLSFQEMGGPASPIDIGASRRAPTSPASHNRQPVSMISALHREMRGGPEASSAMEIAGRGRGGVGAYGRESYNNAHMAGMGSGTGSQWTGARPISMNTSNSGKPRRESLAGSLVGGMSWGGVSVGSWIRDDIIMAGTSPFAYQSPSFHSSSYLPKLEAHFMKNFSCCGITLPSLHDLVQHYEVSHANQPVQQQPSQLPQGGAGNVPQGGSSVAIPSPVAGAAAAAGVPSQAPQQTEPQKQRQQQQQQTQQPNMQTTSFQSIPTRGISPSATSVGGIQLLRQQQQGHVAGSMGIPMQADQQMEAVEDMDMDDIEEDGDGEDEDTPSPTTAHQQQQQAQMHQTQHQFQLPIHHHHVQQTHQQQAPVQQQQQQQQQYQYQPPMQPTSQQSPVQPQNHHQQHQRQSSQHQFAQQMNHSINLTAANMAMPVQHLGLRTSQPTTPLTPGHQFHQFQNNPTVSSVNTPTLVAQPSQHMQQLQQAQSPYSSESPDPDTPVKHEPEYTGLPPDLSMPMLNQFMAGYGYGFGGSDMLDLCIDEPAKRLFSPNNGSFSNQPQYNQLRMGGPHYASNTKNARDTPVIGLGNSPTPGSHPEESKPFKCPVIGCEKAYKNQNGLKYHKSHGHMNQQLHENSDGSYSIVNPETSVPYPGTLGMEKEKPYRCDVCGKRYKNLNGLKYHKAHTPTCNPDFKLGGAINKAGMSGIGPGEEA
ncbi:MAG: Transcriptional regulator of ribosomal biogenesis proteins [Trizodia sp. TS-e1964]|nr:MAG: Transcriptional regulator of ribosomal biogenesis proteins [Trizodia sp. TS-e1964]